MRTDGRHFNVESEGDNLRDTPSHLGGRKLYKYHFERGGA